MSKDQEQEGTNLLYDLISQAKEYEDSIVMGRGDPDLDAPAFLRESTKTAIRVGQNRYTPSRGLKELRESIADRMEKINDVKVDPDSEIVVTNGGQEGIFLTINSLLEPGDDIIVPVPNYNTYNDAIEFVGANKVEVMTYAEEDFEVMPHRVEEALTPQSKVLLMVSPNNPTAGVISRENVKKLSEIAKDNDLLVLADDTYDLFVYEDTVHTDPASLTGMKARTLSLNTLSKTYSLTGVRVGWVAGPENLMERVLRFKESVTGRPNYVAQQAGIAALNGPEDHVRFCQETYKKRRKLVLDTLDSLGLSYGTPRGAQFVFCNIESTGMKSVELARTLLEEAHVLVYPGRPFAGERWDNFVRITFLQPESKLAEGLERMENVFKEKGLD